MNSSLFTFVTIWNFCGPVPQYLGLCLQMRIPHHILLSKLKWKKFKVIKKSVVISCKKENQITEKYISEHEVFIHLMKYACNTKWLGFINCIKCKLATIKVLSISPLSELKWNLALDTIPVKANMSLPKGGCMSKKNWFFMKKFVNWPKCTSSNLQSIIQSTK